MPQISNKVQADAVAELLVDFGNVIKKRFHEPQMSVLTEEQRGDIAFRASLHMLAQQIALGIAQDRNPKTDLKAVFNTVATRIRNHTEAYVKTMKSELEKRNVKNNGSKH